MISFSVKYKDDALAVLQRVNAELQNCFDFIDKSAAKRLEETILADSEEKSVELDERWLYVISEALNLLDKNESDEYMALRKYIRELRGYND